MATLHEDEYTLFITSRSFLLRMRNVSDKRRIKNRNTHLMFNNIFFSKIEPFMRKCGKILWSRAGHRWQYNTAHALCMLAT